MWCQGRELAENLGKERLAARTVQIKVRHSDFKTLTRQTSVEDPVETAEDIYAIACSILKFWRMNVSKLPPFEEIFGVTEAEVLEMQGAYEQGLEKKINDLKSLL